jgi:hypothetical protein
MGDRGWRANAVQATRIGFPPVRYVPATPIFLGITSLPGPRKVRSGGTRGEIRYHADDETHAELLHQAKILKISLSKAVDIATKAGLERLRQLANDRKRR